MDKVLVYSFGIFFFCYYIFYGIRDGLIRKETRGGYGIERLTGKDAVRQGWVQIGGGVLGLIVLAYVAWYDANRDERRYSVPADRFPR